MKTLVLTLGLLFAGVSVSNGFEWTDDYGFPTAEAQRVFEGRSYRSVYQASQSYRYNPGYRVQRYATTPSQTYSRTYAATPSQTYVATPSRSYVRMPLMTVRPNTVRR